MKVFFFFNKKITFYYLMQLKVPKFNKNFQLSRGNVYIIFLTGVCRNFTQVQKSHYRISLLNQKNISLFNGLTTFNILFYRNCFWKFKTFLINKGKNKCNKNLNSESLVLNILSFNLCNTLFIYSIKLFWIPEHTPKIITTFFSLGLIDF